MAWKPKHGTWWKPRTTVEPRQIGPNTVRYEAKKSVYQNEKFTTPTPSNSQYASVGRNHRRTYWNDGYDDDIVIDRTPKKKAFSWTPTRWSTFTFHSILDDDDNSELFVKDPESYLTPTASEIKGRVHVYTKEKLDRIKDLARVCYFKMIDDKDYVSDFWKQRDDTSEYQKKKEIYDNVFETFVPGFSPLEQAIAIHFKLEDNDAKKARNKHQGRDGSRNTFEFKREDYADPAINNQLDLNELSKDKRMEILNNISIIGDLGNQFKVEKETGERVVANSPTYRRKTMRDYEQFSRMEIYQKMFPNFRIKFLTKDLSVNVPVETSEKKQKIIILCDYSGSMNETEKQIWVNSLLIDRFRYVIKGEAEIFFSTFVSNPNQLHFHHIKDAKDVTEFWRTFSNYPSGSYTDIGRIVKHVAEEVAKGKLHNLKVDLSKEKPEILIINDGQDEVGHDSFPYKVNAISLMQFSDELKNLCTATGGKQVRITSNNRITAYSKDKENVVEEVINE